MEEEGVGAPGPPRLWRPVWAHELSWGADNGIQRTLRVEDGACGEGSDCAHTLGIPRPPWRLARRSFLGIVTRQLHAQQIPQKSVP